NQLADLLEVNRNTVNLVYTQLRDEGYLSIHKGRGTQVLRNVRVEELGTNRQVMHKLMLNIIEEATKQNIPLTEFLVAGLAYALLQDRSFVETKIAFIECCQHDHMFYRNEIKRITNEEVTMVALEELRSQGSTAMEVINSASIIVTTLN